MVEEAVSAVLLLKDEDERDLVDGIVLKHSLVTRSDDLFSLVHTYDFECVVKVGDWDLLDLQHIVGVENGREIFRRQKLRLELVKTVVVGVYLAELFLLDRLQHFENRLLGVSRLLIQNVSHEFLRHRFVKACQPQSLHLH